MMPLVMLIMSLVTVAIIWFGAHRINAARMQIGDVMAIIEYAMNILMYVIMAVFCLIYIPRAKVCAARIREVLDFSPEITDSETPDTIEFKTRLRLEFKDVTFSYAKPCGGVCTESEIAAEKPVLRNISFTCESGTTTAIIGGTGSGKSTLGRLIPRLLDASSGEVRLCGVNVKDLPQKAVRKRVGFVPQKAFLFSGSIAENLRHGNAKATDDELKQAAEIAQATDFIEEKGGIDSAIEQGGKNLSGGQRQRLSIARMLMKKPDIYLFDDSFSALDFKTDAALRKSLKSVTADSIVINIAQRISTIRDAEQIIVLDEGQIAGTGTHGELMKSCEVYQEIAKSQLSEEELSL
jgi:ATP-binding cassette subfamily B protein